SIGLSASTIGIVLSTYAIAAFIVRTVLPKLVAKFKGPRVLTYAFYTTAASLLLVPFFTNPIVLGLISFVFGLGMGTCGPIITMLMFIGAPEGRSGEALGLKITINHMTKVVTPVIFGAVASAIGLPPVFWADAALLAAGGVINGSRGKGNSRG